MTKTTIALSGLVLAPLLFVTLPKLVTAAVTAAPAGAHQAVVTNNRTGKKMPWVGKTWPSLEQCSVALGTLPLTLAQMRALAGNNPDGEVSEPTGVDPDLHRDMLRLSWSIRMNTGVMPDLSLTCEPLADPV